MFIMQGEQIEQPIATLPGCARLSIDRAVDLAQRAQEAGILGLALFPVIDEHHKDPTGSFATDASNVLLQALPKLRAAAPELLLITDVALDPYSSDGHDGFVDEAGEIVNDITVPLLAEMAVAQAAAGAHVVAPSDMMDGRIGAIRRALDNAGHTDVGICSYCCKYASAFYGPFRDALDSAPRGGDKKTYQMDFRSDHDIEREIRLDTAEGADWLMIKPGQPYLDVLHRATQCSQLPLAVYQVSGEYAALHAGAAAGILDYQQAMLESMAGFRRAGADIIFTYAALEIASWLQADV
jgi:porphobilinogen synthase